MQSQTPQHTAAQLLSQDKASLPNIAIQPKGDHERGYAPEIISIKENKLDGKWEIEVRWKTLEEKLQLDTEEIKSLFPEVKHEETANRLAQQINDCWLAIDEELARPRISMAFAERQQQLGTSTIEKKYWKTSALLDEKQQAVLCYFLPYAERIKKNTAEMAYCFSTFLGRPVEVERIERSAAQTIHQKSIPLHQWQVGLNGIVGGWGEAKADEICIKISSEKETDLKTFLPGQPQRLLLDQVLLPAFVDAKMGRQIELKIKKDQAFIIGKHTTSGVGFFNISA